ncbi:MAG: PAS domain-containing protein [Alphaproteobacteria bacterium]|nr:PAS domain-containing protein [Alphaproteobacteria bacterium]
MDAGLPDPATARFGDPTRAEIVATVAHPDLHKLYDYWRARGTPGRLPSRRDIDPLDMGFMLGNLILVDVVRDPDGPAPRFRYRLVGANLVNMLGIEMTGRMLDDHPDPQFREVAKRVYARVAEDARPTAARRDAVVDGRVRRYEAIHLPLAADGATVDMVLVGMRFG